MIDIDAEIARATRASLGRRGLRPPAHNSRDVLAARYRLRPVFDGRNDHCHPATLHGRIALDLHGIAQLSEDFPEDSNGALAVNTLTPAEEHGELHLVSVLQERPGVIHLYLAIVRVGLRAKTDLLQDDHVSPLGGFLSLLPIVLEFAVVHDTADGRSLHGRYFDEVQSGLTRQAQGLIDGDDTQLLLVLVNYPNR
jgi:hypothetical protein